jgi:hypothetical protein
MREAVAQPAAVPSRVFDLIDSARYGEALDLIHFAIVE